MCSQDCPTLPAVPAGYVSVGVFAPDISSGTVNFGGNPLEVCFAVSGPVGSLSYEIGPPFAGPTALYQGQAPPSGCLADSGNDSGPTVVTITATGGGMWLVQIDEATSAYSQQQEQEQQAIDMAAANVNSDASTLTTDDPSTINDDVSTLNNDLSTVNNDLGTEQDDYGTFQNDLSGNNDACSDISGLDQDAQSIAGDAVTLWNDSHTGLLVDIAGLQRSMASARTDWADYEKAQAALPNYQPSQSVPSFGGSLATAQAAINGAVSQANSDIDQANGVVEQAYALANRADQVGHCGHPVAVPVPLKHIAPAMYNAR